MDPCEALPTTRRHCRVDRHVGHPGGPDQPCLVARTARFSGGCGVAGVLIGRSASGVGVDVGRRCLSRSLLQHQIVVVMRAWSQIVVLLIAAAALTSMSLLSSINIVASSSTASTLHAHPLSAPPGPSQSVPPPPPPKLTADPLSSSHSPCAPALSAELTHAAARNNDLGMAVATFANQAQADFARIGWSISGGWDCAAARWLAQRTMRRPRG